MMNYSERLQPPILPVEKIVIPEAKTFRLDNGIQVYLIEAGTEDIMRAEFVFRAGQIKEEIPLVSSTCNMMLSEGTENYTAEDLNSMIDSYGIFFGQNAEKDNAGITLFFLTRHIEKALELGNEILFRPVFPEHELNSLIKKRLRWFLVNRSKVQNMALDRFFESIFGKHHPYGYQIKEEDFERISADNLKDFHLKHYVPSEMSVIISGKIHERTIDLLNKYFGSKATSVANIDEKTFPVKSENNKKVHIEKTGAVQTAIRIGSLTINKRHPDYPGLKVLDTILGGYFSSRLMKNVREDKGYTYGINSSVSSLEQSGFKVISAEVGKQYLRKATEEIYNEIRILQNEPVSNEELTVVRNYMSGEMLRMFDGPFALAESFKAVWEMGLDNNYYYQLSDKIKTIEPDEIIELARTYYNIDDLYEVTAGSE